MSRYAGTRAVAHWAWRMFRRDWREQALVLVLLTIAVGVSSYGAALGHAVAPTDQASFGSATGRIRYVTSDQQLAASTMSAARKSFGTVEEITDESVPIPGSVRHLDLRTQDPHGAFGTSMLRLRSGRYPASDGEVALTASMSQFLAAPVGSAITVGGATRRVVGLVENPAQLDDAFGLVATASAGQQLQHTLLVKATASQLAAFRSSMASPESVIVDQPVYYSHDLGVLLVAALGMMLVAVLALTAFLVLAQRRVRQLGMLAAVGATRRQVRNVTVFHGLIVGAIAGAVGTVTAGVCWELTGPLITLASGKRVSWSSVPLWLIVTPGVMAVVTSSLAAWWPARTMARIPVVRALSNRPPEPMPGRHNAAAAAIALAIGVVCLRYAHQRNALLMIAGLAAMIGAILLTAPLLIHAATARSGQLPIAARLAWRQLQRNQSRSAAALATVTMAVGISVSAVVITAANAHPATAGNLSNRQILVHAEDIRDPSLVPPRTASQTNSLDNQVSQLASGISQAQVITLSAVVDPTATPTALAQSAGALDVVQLVRENGNHAQSYPLFLATPQLLTAFRAKPAQLDNAQSFAAQTSGTWSLLNAKREPIPAPKPLPGAVYTSLPQTLASPAMLAEHHWQQVRAGWIIQTPGPLTAQQDQQARRLAATLGLSIDTRDPQAYLGRLRVAFTIGGILITLAVIAIALVLLRTQTTRDQQILTAVGTASRTRRAIATATATALSALGSLLGLTGAYLTLLLAYSDTLSRLTNIPLSALATITLGIPLLTLITTWLTTSRQPPAINRPVLD